MLLLVNVIKTAIRADSNDCDSFFYQILQKAYKEMPLSLYLNVHRGGVLKQLIEGH